MEKQKISKKWPIAVAICWLVVVTALYITQMAYTILKPEVYLAHVRAGWPITLTGTALCVITVAFAALVLILSKKAGIKWMVIVSRVHLFAYSGFSVLFALVTLAYL